MNVKWDKNGKSNITLVEIPKDAEVRIRVNKKTEFFGNLIVLFEFTENNMEYRSPFGPPGIVCETWKEAAISESQILTFTLPKAMFVGIGIDSGDGSLYENSTLEKSGDFYHMIFEKGTAIWDIDVKVVNKKF
ncbi:MAG: hypothetical protein HQK84_11840 [Nitrospinae bacterium]|nr:hypothetical protein [Nitrospinota bacterium]